MSLLRKYFVTIFLLSAVSIFMGGCSKSEDSPTENLPSTFVGTWKLTMIYATISGQPITMTPDLAGYQMTIVSKEDGTFLMTTISTAGTIVTTTTLTGNWSIAGENLTLKYSDGTNGTFGFSSTNSNKTFTIKNYPYTSPQFGNILINLEFTKQ